ncbi:hypothetical protein CIT292_09843 [Citrobacter youngae ATCC 29220]|uniref:Uncharacterized protein n=1 Tax=Citrobacter youngae ATCC 29220 TaxID=500640 RepID=D4BH36_9ENTR|nr:hypothetical protein CIT292_09843 [Citrobacter youngae ATCC 29220]
MFPASAGINRAGIRRTATLIRVPRASGDKPSPKQGQKVSPKCSPRQRG